MKSFARLLWQVKSVSVRIPSTRPPWTAFSWVDGDRRASVYRTSLVEQAVLSNHARPVDDQQ